MSYNRKMEEKVITCPFNKSHRIRESGLQYHIIRCMKNYPDYKVCPFNATHRMKPQDLVEHILNCPDQILYNRKSNLETFEHDLAEAPIHVGNPEWNTEEEDWTTDNHQY